MLLTFKVYISYSTTHFLNSVSLPQQLTSLPQEGYFLWPWIQGKYLGREQIGMSFFLSFDLLEVSFIF